jgi:hypothetical protein
MQTDWLGPLVDSEEDPARLWAEIHTLRAAAAGPPGYASWQEAATAERVLRVNAASELRRLQQAGDSFQVVAGHPALWINVRSLRDALDPTDKRNVMPYAYREKQAFDDVCILLREAARA